MASRVYLGLGSNLGDKEMLLRQAIRLIEERIGELSAVSSFLTSEPWGYQSEYVFCNAVVAVDTQLSPIEVLRGVQAIEQALGSRSHRDDEGNYIDRLIDIDLLDYEGVILNTADLVLPHPRMHLRAFVMHPLAEIAPQWVHPTLGSTAVEISRELSF